MNIGQAKHYFREHHLIYVATLSPSTNSCYKSVGYVFRKWENVEYLLRFKGHHIIGRKGETDRYMGSNYQYADGDAVVEILRINESIPLTL